ncbi:lipopolysaccharide transport system ATP-binding protein [Catalinimonas alkaloidigena]|uniref:Lipopolysaccharide transport system ATP-binding protein n=1 Tax=Catalinimonas alkaloidigena TaxID=1075417 RepID=A0A1G9LHE4_9BACT|nr:ABC transporter ATP-binding protein [Catalinimonas alkaloidigena]SDL60945.1 lipopolysaccharide transport system ATP-binding protein [Catalinimonas alkaloidigena]
MNDEVLVSVENVSKKFCKDLKRSLRYGVQDIGTELLGLHTRHERLRPKEFWAVDDISFELKRGECLGLIGHNGAGKSTLLKMLNGLIKPDKGRITMKGRIGALIELQAGFNPILTGRENIYINGSLLGFTKKEIDQKFDAIVEFAEIAEYIDTPVQNYSSGMKVRLGFAVASQMEPDVLIIDEVLAVGDVGFRIKCFNVIAELVQKAAVIFVSHGMPQVARISSSVMLMDKGKEVYHGTDVGKGAELYYRSFDSSAESVVYGDYPHMMRNLRIYTDDTEDTNAFKHLDTLHIQFDLSLPDAFSPFRMVVIIHDNDLKPIATVSKRVDHQPAGEFNIQLTVPSVALDTGKYDVAIAFYHFDTLERPTVLANYRSVGNFYINNTRAASGAPFSLPAEWDISQLISKT